MDLLPTKNIRKLNYIFVFIQHYKIILFRPIDDDENESD
jgi:hypothetical protein